MTYKVNMVLSNKITHLIEMTKQEEKFFEFGNVFLADLNRIIFLRFTMDISCRFDFSQIYADEVFCG